MKKKIILILLIILTFIIYFVTSDNKITSLDYKGHGSYFKVSMNFSKKGKTELRVTPRRDDFLVPEKICLEIEELNGDLHKEEISYSKDEGFYILRYPTRKPFKTRVKELNISIKWLEKTDIIKLKLNLLNEKGE